MPTNGLVRAPHVSFVFFTGVEESCCISAATTNIQTIRFCMYLYITVQYELRYDKVPV